MRCSDPKSVGRGRRPRAAIDESYSLDVCIPPLKDFFERVAKEKATG